MEKLFKSSKRWMTAFGVVAFLMVAGWQVGADGMGNVFTGTEVALENAVANSDGGGPNSYCSVSSNPDNNEGGCRENPYGGDVCVKYSHGPACNGTRN